MTCTGRRISGAFAVLLALSVGASAQQPTPQQPASPAAPVAAPATTTPPPAPPKLEEVLELRRTNYTLRQNLLAAQMQNLKNMIDRENSEITALLASLRADVEKSHPGWTIGDDGVMAPKQKK